MGTSVIQNLAVAGIERLEFAITIWLILTIYLAETLWYKDVGKQKAIISRQKLQEMNIQTDSEIHNICLTDKKCGLPYAKTNDILVDTTDNF